MTEPIPTTTAPRRRPNLAVVIALLAVVFALTTSASALPGSNTVDANDLKTNSVTTRAIKAQAVTPAKIKDQTMFAVVTADGTVVQSRGILSVARDSAGIYFVTFARSVVARAMSVTVYNEGAGAGQANIRHCSTQHPLGQVCTAGNDPRLLLVNTEDSAGTNADRQFMVVAMPLAPGTTTTTAKVAKPSGDAEGR